MATRLSPRNSEVNALEQRGYLIGKKIGQVVHCSLLSFVRSDTSRSFLPAPSSALAVALPSIYYILYNDDFERRLINLSIISSFILIAGATMDQIKRSFVLHK